MTREYAAVDIGRDPLRERIERMTAFDHGSDASRADLAHGLRIRSQYRNRLRIDGVRREGAHCGGDLGRLVAPCRREVGTGQLAQLRLELVFPNADRKSVV